MSTSATPASSTVSMTTMLISVVLVAVVAFGGGYWFGTSRKGAAGNRMGNFQAGMGFNRDGAAGGARGGMGGRGGAGGGAVIGELEKNDAGTLTVKLPNGGSKLVITTSSTKAMRMTDSSLDEIAIGTNIVVNGTANADGSVTAQTVQVRPAMMFGGNATSTR